MASTKFTRRSANPKTGPMSVTSRTHDTCPKSCPLYGSGCYAETGPGGGIFMLAAKHGVEDEEAVFAEMMREVPPESGLRWNVSGDVVRSDGETIDEGYVGRMNAFHAARPDVWTITYTHAWRNAAPAMFNRPANASCETLDDVDKALADGWQAVLTVPTDEDVPVGRRPDGRSYVRCPYDTHHRQCVDCRLCSKGGAHRAVVVFVVHGSQKRKAQAAIRKQAAAKK